MREVNKARHAVAIVKILDRFECNLTPDWFQTSGKSTVLSACNGSGSNYACLSPLDLIMTLNRAQRLAWALEGVSASFLHWILTQSVSLLLTCYRLRGDHAR